ncbi:hypothetical protein T08_112 [Trichinella sp. T8]|nr:hypothetical protein T08_112 [Trichinella sp. T8]
MDVFKAFFNYNTTVDWNLHSEAVQLMILHHFKFHLAKMHKCQLKRKNVEKIYVPQRIFLLLLHVDSCSEICDARKLISTNVLFIAGNYCSESVDNKLSRPVLRVSSCNLLLAGIDDEMR